MWNKWQVLYFYRKLSHIVSVQKTTPDTSYSDRIKEAEYNLANGKYRISCPCQKYATKSL